MEKLSRRSFFKLAGGGVAAAVIAPALLAEQVTEVAVDFGFTFGPVPVVPGKDKLFSEVICKTLQENAPKIRENMVQNNALLAKLKDGQKVLIKINKITPEEQIKRINTRLDNRKTSEHYRISEKLRMDQERDRRYFEQLDRNRKNV